MQRPSSESATNAGANTATDSGAPRTRRRLPAFHPLPCARHDGWTAARQADFIGMLAETRSVAKAARAVGMGRESAYRLRRRAGAAGFAAAWDTALGIAHTAVDLASMKATGLGAYERLERGLIEVRMYRGRYRGSACKPDINALLQHHAAMERMGRMLDQNGLKQAGLDPADRVNGERA